MVDMKLDSSWIARKFEANFDQDEMAWPGKQLESPLTIIDPEVSRRGLRQTCGKQYVLKVPYEKIGTLSALGEAKETFSKPAPLETTLGEKWSGHLRGSAGVWKWVERGSASGGSKWLWNCFWPKDFLLKPFFELMLTQKSMCGESLYWKAPHPEAIHSIPHTMQGSEQDSQTELGHPKVVTDYCWFPSAGQCCQMSWCRQACFLWSSRSEILLQLWDAGLEAVPSRL